MLTDPPPDLVIEIDITHSSRDKLPLFDALGIAEVWRYDGGTFTILCRSESGYNPREHSQALPSVNPR